MKVEKTVTKLYVVENNKNTVCAEVIEGCGCGFDYLIRINPKHKYDLDIFYKCLKLCNKDLKSGTFDMSEFYEKGYPFDYENVAFVCDDIIQ